MQNHQLGPNLDNNAQFQIGFAIPPHVDKLLSEWWFWWRFYRVAKQVIAVLLRKFDRKSRWYLLIKAIPGPNAKTTRQITLCRGAEGSQIWRYVKHRLIVWARVGEQKYSFRLRFNRCAHVTVNIDSSEFVLAQPSASQTVVLASGEKNKPIKSALTLVLKSDGWPSEESALQNGQRFSNALKRSFAKLGVGANYGEFGPKGAITKAGSIYFEESSGERVLDDAHGLMVYSSLPEPQFGKVSITPLVGKPEVRLAEAFREALALQRDFDEREKVAFQLFNSSFFQETPISRFILLVMTIEAFLVSEPRSIKVREHVQTLIDQTKNSEELTDEEKQSLMSQMGRLKEESIKQAGRRLSRDRLGARKYEGQSASDFFARCYDLRSSLVHGDWNTGLRQNCERVVSTLEIFVTDILSAPLRLGKDKS